MLACLLQPPTYEVFLEDYEQAHAAYIRAVDDFHNFPTGDKSPESYEASYRLGLACDRLNAATDALMTAPAPDLGAVAFKMERLLSYMEEIATDDAPAIALQQAIAAAKSGDARTARKFSVPAVQWADGEFNCPGRECPEKTILADLQRLSR